MMAAISSTHGDLVPQLVEMNAVGNDINEVTPDEEMAVDADHDSEHQLQIEESEAHIPMVGMVFDNVDEILEYYQKYAQTKGFSVVKRGVRRGAAREVRYQTFICNRARIHTSRGKDIYKRRPSFKVGCLARVSVMKHGEMWKITQVSDDHNHSLSPRNSRFLKQHRKISTSVRRDLESRDMAGIRPAKVVRSVVLEAGGPENMTCLPKDLHNHIDKFRRLQLSEGDAVAVSLMFQEMQQNSRDFFYAFDLHEDGKLKNLFWADGRSRAAYQEFGDVISFDSTYLVNKYHMPFCPFVGVNHHGQSTLFGCALLCDESVRTYEWVLQTWLRCMDNKKPDAIVTDQCGAIGAAVQSVFDGVRHRWCLWHIMRKRPDKLGGLKDFAQTNETLKDIVHDSASVAEFEEKWQRMAQLYNLQGNTWLNSLFKDRHKWVPVYFGSTFWAGMQTTQRSESMNSYFDKYIHSRSTLKQFVEQYQHAMHDKIEQELEADFVATNKLIPCVTTFPFERQFQKAFTNYAFNLVQAEVMSTWYCEVESSVATDGLCSYQVKERKTKADGSTKYVIFQVDVQDLSNCMACSCLLFEFKGIVCRHMFRVCMCRNIEQIPDKYLLRRWRKDVGRCHSKIFPAKVGGKFAVEIRRAKDLEKIFYSCVDLAVAVEDSYALLRSTLVACYSKLEVGSNSVRSSRCDNATIRSLPDLNANPHGASLQESSVSQWIQDPAVVKTRGRPKGKRIPSRSEACRVSNQRVRQKKSTNIVEIGREKAHGLSLFPQSPNLVTSNATEQSSVGQLLRQASFRDILGTPSCPTNLTLLTPSPVPSFVTQSEPVFVPPEVDIWSPGLESIVAQLFPKSS